METQDFVASVCIQ